MNIYKKLSRTISLLLLTSCLLFTTGNVYAANAASNSFFGRFRTVIGTHTPRMPKYSLSYRSILFGSTAVASCYLYNHNKISTETILWVDPKVNGINPELFDCSDISQWYENTENLMSVTRQFYSISKMYNIQDTFGILKVLDDKTEEQFKTAMYELVSNHTSEFNIESSLGYCVYSEKNWAIYYSLEQKWDKLKLCVNSLIEEEKEGNFSNEKRDLLTLLKHLLMDSTESTLDIIAKSKGEKLVGINGFKCIVFIDFFGMLSRFEIPIGVDSATKDNIVSLTPEIRIKIVVGDKENGPSRIVALFNKLKGENV